MANGESKDGKDGGVTVAVIKTFGTEAGGPFGRDTAGAAADEEASSEAARNSGGWLPGGTALGGGVTGGGGGERAKPVWWALCIFHIRCQHNCDGIA